MEWLSGKKDLLQAVKRYRYVLIVLAAGILLMLLPETEASQPLPETEVTGEIQLLQDQLSRILSKVEGAGRVEVLLTQSAGEEILYQSNEDTSYSDSGREQNKETVLVTNGSREETGLIRQVIPPTYQGAVVISQGADSAAVRLALMEAVKSATGLSANAITVLKMK